ncbi:cobalamin biosynthesis bifunctional protein CbiET [Pleomorphomonas diazotrophica]|uniref:Cobalamin biosynthesis bifunctional protein CbiET n=1 Tax=Pleomorphomonas diazotrophica TaxID=1166257 RepID=A0A1I4SUE4_9HYPH|nr:precorrin-6y C5,15-methyltransferase (decarboxylating) subunit CbiE [Pleomorphomonas diazotrophica]PKR88675.1 cobalamin biosynthesis bifunctional protein CbiET [Pleomorphomonas diazotrophica]SFM68106.1 precorrin-6Y C5,15-methyltransferase (decarboxylating) [Pleomorphomonas diazotrophica]
MAETSLPPWLTIVGLGEDGLDGLSPAAVSAIAQAGFIVGGRRHLDLIKADPAISLVWPSPLKDAFPAILARRGSPVAVLASGDPFFYGVGSLLAEIVDPREMTVLPAPSAFALAAARLGWPGQDVVRVSLHGRALERVLPHVQPGARLLALSWDGTTPAKLATLLTTRGLGKSRLTVLEAMGGLRERRRSASADAFDIDDIDPLNLVAIEVEGGRDARVIPFTPGLPDDWFEHDGQISKREIRALTVAALRPTRGETLWDVGAGSGSVAIEWMLSDPSLRAFALEENAPRAARIMRNALSFGVPDLQVIESKAPDGLHNLPDPDAIFIGGGSGDPGVVDTCVDRLRSGGRLVINAVTVETTAEVFALQARLGGELTQIAISRLDRIGGFHALRPALPVVQWTWVKP